MASATRGPLIRRIPATADKVPTTAAIPSNQRDGYADGYDVSVVIEVKRHRIRAMLAVTSGGEMVLPDWLRKLLPMLAEEQGVTEASIYLSTRPIWLVKGAQDEAAQIISTRLHTLPPWERLGVEDREAVVAKWVAEKLAPRSKQDGAIDDDDDTEEA